MNSRYFIACSIGLIWIGVFGGCGGGITSGGGGGGDFSVGGTADLASANGDLASSDLSMAAQNDLSMTGDLATSIDLSMTPDLASPPDLTVIPDLASPPDLTVIPDMAIAPVYVIQHHRNNSRDGLYSDPAFTKAKAATLHRDLTFTAMMQGPTYAQPLYFENGPNGKALLIVATEQNLVYAFDAANGNVVWQVLLRPPVPLANLPCGDINPLGVTGTPYIDVASRTIYVAAMTTPDGGTTKRHLIFALSVDNGQTKNGWPVDVTAKVKFNNLSFDSSVENQRGALQVVNGTLYVPYGGHYGDCGVYHGWVVGVPVANPAIPMGWATRAQGGGIWAPGGLSSDGTAVFAATGNTFGANVWSDGEAIIRLNPGPLFSQQPIDYFTPANWQQLDNADTDIGGSGPLLVDVAGATPSKLVVGLGKDGNMYLLDRSNLGGIGKQVAVKRVASGVIINAAAAYTTAKGTFVAFRGAGVGCPNGAAGDLVGVQITPANPPGINVVWCATQNGRGSPMVTTTDGTSEAVVWGIGAENDNRLHGFDGETGAVIFNGGNVNDQMSQVRRFNTAIAARGRIYVAADNQLYAFKTN